MSFGELKATMLSQVHAVFAETVTFVRGTDETAGHAIPVAAEVGFEDGKAGIVVVSDRTFAVRTSAYAFGGIAVTPRAGDVVVWNGSRYEVIRAKDYSRPGHVGEWLLPCRRIGAA